MADQNTPRRLQTQNADEVAQNTATGTNSDNSDRDQTGEANRKEGHRQKERTEQGGGGGKSGGGGGQKNT